MRDEPDVIINDRDLEQLGNRWRHPNKLQPNHRLEWKSILFIIILHRKHSVDFAIAL